jgi:uncharacterized protein YecT (DUF1311 family)
MDMYERAEAEDASRSVDEPFGRLKENAVKLDKDGRECMGDRDTSGQAKCLTDFIPRWDQQLNDTYKALTKAIPESEIARPDAQKLLKESEQQWAKFQQSETRLGAYMKDPVFKLSTKEDVIKDRANELLSYGVGIDASGNSVSLKEQQTLMNGYYGELLSQLSRSPRAQDAVVQSQNQWKSFMNAEFKFIDSIAPVTAGSDPIFNQILKANIVADRAQELKMLGAYGMR